MSPPGQLCEKSMVFRRSLRRAWACTGLLALGLALPVVAPPGPMLATPVAQPIPPPPCESLFQAPQEQLGSLAAKPVATKLDSALDALAGAPGLAAQDERVEVQITLDPTNQTALASTIADLGGAVRIVSVAGDALLARVPAAALPQFAEIPQIQMVR